MPDLEKTISGLWEIVAWAEAKPYITTAAQMESALSAAKDAIALLEKQRKKKWFGRKKEHEQKHVHGD